MDWSVWVGIGLLGAAGFLYTRAELQWWAGVGLGLAPVLPVLLRLRTLAPAAVAEPLVVTECARIPERLQLRLMAAALLAASFLFMVTWLLKSVELASAGRLAVALLPIPAFALFIVAEVAVLLRMDELQKRIQLEALAIAFPAVAVLGITVEYLQKAGFVSQWTVGDVWPYMILLYLPAYVVSRWRYR